MSAADLRGLRTTIQSVWPGAKIYHDLGQPSAWAPGGYLYNSYSCIGNQFADQAGVADYVGVWDYPFEASGYQEARALSTLNRETNYVINSMHAVPVWLNQSHAASCCSLVFPAKAQILEWNCSVRAALPAGSLISWYVWRQGTTATPLGTSRGLDVDSSRRVPMDIRAAAILASRWGKLRARRQRRRPIVFSSLAAPALLALSSSRNYSPGATQSESLTRSYTGSLRFFPLGDGARSTLCEEMFETLRASRLPWRFYRHSSRRYRWRSRLCAKPRVGAADERRGDVQSPRCGVLSRRAPIRVSLHLQQLRKDG